MNDSSYKRKIKIIVATIITIFIIVAFAITVRDTLIVDSYFETSPITIAFFIIFFSVLLFIVAVLVVPYLDKKKPITEESFKEKLESKGYVISDATNEFSDYDYITKVYSAINKEFRIQFYNLKDEEHARMFYRNTELSIEQSKENFINKTSTSSKYTILSNTSYKVISRISNTVICLQVPNFSMKEAKEILKELGY